MHSGHEMKDAWHIAAKFPKAAVISDAYLRECELWIQGCFSEASKPAASVQAGVVLLVMTGLISVQYPYWFAERHLHLSWVVCLAVLAVGAAELCVLIELFKELPVSLPKECLSSASSLRAFWEAVSQSPNALDDHEISEKIQIFIRQDRERRFNAFCTAVDVQNKKRSSRLFGQLGGLLVLTIFTVILLALVHH